MFFNSLTVTAVTQSTPRALSTPRRSAGGNGSPIDCDFETQSICGYTQLPSTGNPHDQMDFGWTSGRIQGVRYSPSTDHTLQNDQGNLYNLCKPSMKKSKYPNVLNLLSIVQPI